LGHKNSNREVSLDEELAQIAKTLGPIPKAASRECMTSPVAKVYTSQGAGRLQKKNRGKRNSADRHGGTGVKKERDGGPKVHFKTGGRKKKLDGNERPLQTNTAIERGGWDAGFNSGTIARPAVESKGHEGQRGQRIKGGRGGKC